jgi:pilus assembly protein Flp/PilA
MYMRLIKDERGSNALEYGLIIGFVTLAIIVGVQAAGLALSNLYTSIGTMVGNVATTISG